MIEDTKIAALASVISKDSYYLLRRVMRWYSETYHTPLHIVENDLPLEDVLRNYFEVHYESYSQEDLDKEIQSLLESPEDKKKRLMGEDFRDAEAEEFASLVMDSEAKTPAGLAEKLEEATEKLTGSLASATEVMEKLEPEVLWTFESQEPSNDKPEKPPETKYEPLI